MSDKMNVGSNFFISYIPRQLDGAGAKPVKEAGSESPALAGDSVTINLPAAREKSPEVESKTVKGDFKAPEKKVYREDPDEKFATMRPPEIFVPQGTVASGSVSSVPTSFFMEDPGLATLGDVDVPSDIKMRDTAGPGTMFFGTGLNSLSSMAADGAIYSIDGEKLN